MARKKSLNQLYRSACLRSAVCAPVVLGTLFVTSIALLRRLSEHPSFIATLLAGLSWVALTATGLWTYHAWSQFLRLKQAENAIRRQFRVAENAVANHLEELYEHTPAAKADRVLTTSLSDARSMKESIEARWEEHRQSLSWWGHLTQDPPDLSEFDRVIKDLEERKVRLDKSGFVAKERARFDQALERVEARLTRARENALDAIRYSRLSGVDETAIARSAIIFSAMSIPASVWDDCNRAGSIYDALRRVNSDYAGLDDHEIWFQTLLLSEESLAGLASLTKGAYFESLVASDLGGQLFENFNNPDTDMLLDGIGYQIKATDSQSYLSSVSEGVPTIATSEIAEITGVMDGGYTNAQLRTDVDLAIGGSVIDIEDTAVDAVLSGLGGVGILSTLRGITHAIDMLGKKEDAFEAVLSGAGVAVMGAAKATVDMTEIGYNLVTSKPARVVGRIGLKIASRIGRKTGD